MCGEEGREGRGDELFCDASMKSCVWESLQRGVLNHTLVFLVQPHFSYRARTVVLNLRLIVISKCVVEVLWSVRDMGTFPFSRPLITTFQLQCLMQLLFSKSTSLSLLICM